MSKAGGVRRRRLIAAALPFLLAMVVGPATAVGDEKGAATGSAPAGGTPSGEASATRQGTRFISWWQDEKVCAELGIGPELRRQLATELENLQTSYHLTQTKLNEARQRQTAMLLDPASGRDQLMAFNRAEVVPLSEKMQALNFDARLAVRHRLSREQLTRLAASHPQFFTARWFKRSNVPVLEGKVLNLDE